MRFRFWHLIVFLTALVVFAIARAPASVFAPQRPGAFEYARAEGTIWNARFERVRLGAYDAGAMTWRLNPLDLVQGKAIADIGFSGGAIAGGVQLLGNWRGDRRLVAEDVAIEGVPFGQGLLAGTTRVQGLDIFFSGGVCRDARGAVQSDALARNEAALRWRGPPVSGQAACAGEAARIDIGGNDEFDQVQALVELRANGDAQWRAEVRTSRPDAQAALAAAGFQTESGALARGGEMRWLPF